MKENEVDSLVGDALAALTPVNAVTESAEKKDAAKGFPVNAALAAQPGLYNRREPQYYIKHEAPQHRQMILLASQGYTVKEIAEMTGFTTVAVSNILRQPHAQQILTQEIKSYATQDEAVMELLNDQARKAVETVVGIMNDDEARPSDRLAAARELLDRKYGKPNQPVTHRESVNLEKLSDEELAAMIPKANVTQTATSDV